MYNPLRILVTGATGFLGRNILSALATRPDVHLVAAGRSPERLVAGQAHELGSLGYPWPQLRQAVGA